MNYTSKAFSQHVQIGGFYVPISRSKTLKAIDTAFRVKGKSTSVQNQNIGSGESKSIGNRKRPSAGGGQRERTEKTKTTTRGGSYTHDNARSWVLGFLLVFHSC